MSDGSGERRRKSSGKRNWLAWAGWGLLVLLLAGNIVFGFLNEKDDTPNGFLTPEHLLAAAFWAPAVFAMVISLCGMYWSSRAHAQSERSSMLWARRGYIFTLVASVAFVLAAMDRDTFPRPWFAALAAALVGGQAFFAAMISLREYRRAEMGEGGRRGRSRSSASEMPAPPTSLPSAATSPPPAAPGTGPVR